MSYWIVVLKWAFDTVRSNVTGAWNHFFTTSCEEEKWTCLWHYKSDKENSAELWVKQHQTYLSVFESQIECLNWKHISWLFDNVDNFFLVSVVKKFWQSSMCCPTYFCSFMPREYLWIVCYIWTVTEQTAVVHVEMFFWPTYIQNFVIEVYKVWLDINIFQKEIIKLLSMFLELIYTLKSCLCNLEILKNCHFSLLPKRDEGLDSLPYFHKNCSWPFSPTFWWEQDKFDSELIWEILIQDLQAKQVPFHCLLLLVPRLLSTWPCEVKLCAHQNHLHDHVLVHKQTLSVKKRIQHLLWPFILLFVWNKIKQV